MRYLGSVLLVIVLAGYGCETTTEAESGGAESAAGGPSGSGGSASIGGVPGGDVPGVAAGSVATGGMSATAGMPTLGGMTLAAGTAVSGGMISVGGSPATGGTVAGSPATGGTVAGSPATGGMVAAAGETSQAGGQEAVNVACTLDQCGPRPNRPVCAGGSVNCERNDAGQCGWVFDEPDADGDGTCDSMDPYCNFDGQPLTCRQVEPDCPDGEVPAVMNGCFVNNACVTLEQCAQRANRGEPGGADGSGEGDGAGGANAAANACEEAGATCRAGGICQANERRIRSACSDEGVACCQGCPNADGDDACDDSDNLCNPDQRPIICLRAMPVCPDGTVPEAEAGCYTGRCVSWADCGQPFRCQANDDCPAGQRCDAGGCLPCICPQNFQPVCGADGRTYSNACAAGCARVDIVFDGACEERQACGGIVGAICPEGQVCVDVPEDNCDPADPQAADCPGVCQPAGANACEDDTDCEAGQWCRVGENNGPSSCVPYQPEGESCDGFVVPWTREKCDPSLRCANVNPQIPDLPGICRRPCNDGGACEDNQYCAEDGVCREDGSCLRDSDCNNRGNNYVHPACDGSGVCDFAGIGGGQCGWVCDGVEPDLCEGFVYQPCDNSPECPGGYECVVRPPQACFPSGCACDPATGGPGVCLQDCSAKAGLCELCPPGGCNRPDCDEAGRCINGAWCPDPRRPECWEEANAICYAANHPISVERCGDGQIDEGEPNRPR